MRPIVMFTNQKGGTGKTTTAREEGITLAARGFRVLLVDSDPQGNLSKGLLDTECFGPGEDTPGLYEALEGEGITLTEARPGLSILRGDARLAALEKRYLGDVDAYEKLKAVLSAPELPEFDIVLIDSPPSLGVMTLNGLAAASRFVIPVRPALYSLQGTNDLLASVAKVKKSLNPDLDLLGVILNEYDSHPVISRQIRAEIEESFGSRVFETTISRTVKVEEAIASRRGVVEGDDAGSRNASPSKIALEIQRLTDEFIARLGLPPGRGRT